MDTCSYEPSINVIISAGKFYFLEHKQTHLWGQKHEEAVW